MHENKNLDEDTRAALRDINHCLDFLWSAGFKEASVVSKKASSVLQVWGECFCWEEVAEKLKVAVAFARAEQGEAVYHRLLGLDGSLDNALAEARKQRARERRNNPSLPEVVFLQRESVGNEMQSPETRFHAKKTDPQLPPLPQPRRKTDPMFPPLGEEPKAAS